MRREIETGVPSWASSVKKGPSTVDSVAPGGLALFMESIKAETPRTSDSRMNSVSQNIVVSGRLIISLG